MCDNIQYFAYEAGQMWVKHLLISLDFFFDSKENKVKKAICATHFLLLQ